MKTVLKTSTLLGCAILVSGCVESFEGTTRATGNVPVRAVAEDFGRDSGSLSRLEAGIYIDPERDFVGVYFSTNVYVPPHGEDKMPGFPRRAAKCLNGDN